MSTNLPYRKSKLSAAILMASVAAFSTTTQAAPLGACTEQSNNVIINNDQSGNTCELETGQSVTVSPTGQLGKISANTVTPGQITNEGNISSSDIGIDITSSTFTGNISNTDKGIITADNNGIFIDESTINGDISNAGNISLNNEENDEHGPLDFHLINSGISVLNESSVTGKVLNSRTITIEEGASEDSAGFLIANSDIGQDNIGDGVINSGAISGTQDKGIFIAESHINGQVLNSGNILNTSSEGFVGIGIIYSDISDSVVNSGAIEGNLLGIIIEGGEVTNNIHNTSAGTIDSYAAGLVVAGTEVGGDIVNDGTITANDKGIGITGSDINGDLINGGSLNVENENDEEAYGILVDGNSTISGNIVNDGSITIVSEETEDSTYGISIEESTISGQVVNNGSITANDKGIGIYIEGSETAAVTNNGTITANDKGIGIYIEDSDMAAVTNNNIITAGENGMLIEHSTINGSITNAENASITSDERGIRIYGDTTVSGSIINEGTIDSYDNGIEMRGGDSVASITGDFTNSGSIEAVDGEAVNFDDLTIGGNFTNTATGYIDSTDNDGIEFESVTLTGNFVNSGSIDGDGGVDIDESSIGGSFTNTSTGTINGDRFGVRAYDLTLTGDFTNDGSITVTNEDAEDSTYGISIEESTISGQVVNNGSITANDKGIGIYIEGSETAAVTNSGTINANDKGIGIYIEDSDTAAVTNNSNITASDNGILIEYSTINGNITNTENGSITSEDRGIRIYGDTTVSGSIINEGTIDSYDNGIEMRGGDSVASITGDFTNSGSIEAVDGEAINFDDLTIGGNFTNTATGYIDSTDNDGIEFESVTLTGNFVNSGSIDGDGGVDIDESSVGGSFTNTSTGTINGDRFGVRAYDLTLTGGFTNDGSITATDEESDGVYIDSDSVLSTFTNNGTIAGASGVNIEGELNNFTNTGTITGSEGDALRFNYLSNAITVNNSGIINGDIELANHTLNISGGEINGDVTGVQDSIVNFTADFTTGGDFWADSTNINAGVTLTLAHELNEAFAVGTVTNDGTIYVKDGETGTINDSYIQTNTGMFKLDLSSAESYGKLVIRDGAEFESNAKIDVNVIGAPSLANNSSIDDVIEAGSITSDGTFEVTDNSAVFNFEGHLDGDTIDLIVKQAIKIKEIASSPAARDGGVADVIDGFIANAPSNQGLQDFVTALGELETVGEVSKAVDQVLPLLTGNQQIAKLSAVGEIGRVIQARTEGQSGMSSSADGEKHLGEGQYVWAQAFGSMADQDDHKSVGGFDADTKGMAIGVDGLVTDQDRVGVSFVYSQSDVDSNDKLNTAEVDTFSLIGYGSHSLDEFTQVSYQAGYGIHKAEGKRYIPLMSTVASSDTDSQSINAAVSLLRNTPISDSTTFTPSFFSQYTWIDNDSYTETGAGALNLKVEGNNTQQWLFGLSGKVSQALNDTFSLDMSAGLAYDLLNEDSQVISAFAGAPGAAFSTTGLERNPLEYRAGVGLNVVSDSNLKLKLSYDYAGRAQFSNQSVAAKLRWSF